MKLMAGIAAATFLVAAMDAQAHYLWVEKGSTGHCLYFGEAEMRLKEKSPGRLDSFEAPQVLVTDSSSTPPRTIPAMRAGDHFSLLVNPNAQAVMVSDESIPVRDLSKNGLGYAKSNYYARFAPSDIVDSQGVQLPLDATTVNKPDAKILTILYHGQPLKGAKVQVIAPNTWMQEHEARADGTVEINTPWRGQYVVHVLHVDKTPRQFGGQNYDSIRNHYTLTFLQSKGNNPGAAIPPKKTME